MTAMPLTAVSPLLRYLAVQVREVVQCDEAVESRRAAALPLGVLTTTASQAMLCGKLAWIDYVTRSAASR